MNNLNAILLTCKFIFAIILPMVINVGKGVNKMKNIKNNLSREIIIENTLALIDENEGSKNVTLRDIAKKLGCAHTNLYNYFKSLEEIFWEALGQALLKMVYYSESNLTVKINCEKGLYELLDNLIDFSMEHPGWYKLIWFDTIGGNPPDEVIKMLNKPGKELIEIIMKVSNDKLSEEKASLIANILHGYLHGELCKWINNRSFMNNRQEIKTKLLSNIKYIYKLMA